MKADVRMDTNPMCHILIKKCNFRRGDCSSGTNRKRKDDVRTKGEDDFLKAKTGDPTQLSLTTEKNPALGMALCFSTQHCGAIIFFNSRCQALSLVLW